jgi:hypothetical protein
MLTRLGFNRRTVHPCYACGQNTTNSRICNACFKRAPQLAEIANSSRRDADEAVRLLKAGVNQ